TDTAKGLTESAKTAIHAATAPPPMTPRENELAQLFGYTVKNGEKIIFASDTKELLVTNRTFLYGWPNGERETVAHANADIFTVYFATDWRYVRAAIFDSELHIFDNILLSEDEAQAFCRALADTYAPAKSGAIQDGLFLQKTGKEWQCRNQAEVRRSFLDMFAEDCGFKLSAGEEVVFVGQNIVNFILTNKNLIINMSYHDAYDKNCYTVMSYENAPLTVQIEPGGTPVHIIPGDSGIADNINLFYTEAVDLIAAIGQSWSGADLAGFYQGLDYHKTAVEIVANPDGTIGCTEYDADENYFTHDFADDFHKNNQPPLGMVFALKAEDGFYYPAEAGKPGEDGLIDVAFMNGQTARLKMKQIVDLTVVFSEMRFHANWENRGDYYPCNLNFVEDDNYTEFIATYLDDGIVEQVNIRRLRAYQ
ncbi:MAG: hypothetical protein FWE80_08140, partial [Oscillospiraceae bacterium]|nr:hypothetical protein [Oscillospiraceae bacterium]